MLMACMTAASAQVYSSENIGDIELPDGMTVINEETDDDSVTLTLKLNGRDDCGFGVRFAYYEDYEGITTNSMSDDLFAEIYDYYTSYLDCSKNAEPQILDITDGDPDYADLNPLMVCGTSRSTGELYLYYELIYDGWDITVFGGTSAKQFDQDSAGAAFNLYFCALEAMMEEE